MLCAKMFVGRLLNMKIVWDHFQRPIKYSGISPRCVSWRVTTPKCTWHRTIFCGQLRRIWNSQMVFSYCFCNSRVFNVWMMNSSIISFALQLNNKNCHLLISTLDPMLLFIGKHMVLIMRYCISFLFSIFLGHDLTRYLNLCISVVKHLSH